MAALIRRAGELGLRCPTGAASGGRCQRLRRRVERTRLRQRTELLNASFAPDGSLRDPFAVVVGRDEMSDRIATAHACGSRADSRAAVRCSTARPRSILGGVSDTRPVRRSRAVRTTRSCHSRQTAQRCRLLGRTAHVMGTSSGPVVPPRPTLSSEVEHAPAQHNGPRVLEELFRPFRVRASIHSCSSSRPSPTPLPGPTFGPVLNPSSDIDWSAIAFASRPPLPVGSHLVKYGL